MQTTTRPSAAPAAPTASPAPPGSLRRYRAKAVAGRAGTLLLAVVTAVVCAVPIVIVFWQAAGLGAAGLAELLTSAEFLAVLGDTVLLVVGSVAIAAVVGTLLAWCGHCLPARRRWLGLIPLLPLVAPPLAMIIGYIFMFDPDAGFVNSALRAILPGTATSGPFDIYSVGWMIAITGIQLSAFMFVFVRSSMAQLHRDLIDAAAVSGAGPVRTFLRAVLPVIRPGVVFGSLTVAVLSMGQFAVPLFLGKQAGVDVLTTVMFTDMNVYPTNYPTAATYGVPILVLGLVLMVVQRVLLRDRSRFETTGGKGSGAPLTTNGPLAQGALALYGLVVVVVPLVGLVFVALQPFWQPDLTAEPFTLANVRAVFADGELVGSIVNTAVFALVTLLVVLPLGYLAAGVIYRRRDRPVLAAVQETIVGVPLGIPAIILGVGFLIAFIYSPLPLYGNTASMVIAYTAITLPFATRIYLTAMTNLGVTLSDAAAAHGATWWRRALRIDLPLLRPAVASAAALIFVLLSHEFSASILIRSYDTQVMGTILYDLYSFGSYGATAVMALLMSVITLGGVVVATLLGGSNALADMEG